MISFVIASVPMVGYVLTNHWNLNNLLGVVFSVTGIDVLFVFLGLITS